MNRFKSRDDYFSRRDSALAERVIAAKSPKPVRKRSVEGAIPSTLLRVHFCKTVEQFEIEGRGRYRKGEYPLDDALRSHLAGDETVLVNPLSAAGETAFTVVRFDLSEAMDLPFSKARQYADELLGHGIPSLIEVAEGGKGHYHLWIFHEEPVVAPPFSDALVLLGRRMFGATLETVPSVRGDDSIALPLQGESALLQRRVFVNAVGKMIKDQAHVLQTIEYCPKSRSEAFILAVMHEGPPEVPPRPAPVTAKPPVPVMHAIPGESPSPVPAIPVARTEPVPAPEPIQKPAVSGKPVDRVSAGTAGPSIVPVKPEPPRVVPATVIPEPGIESPPERAATTKPVMSAPTSAAVPSADGVFIVFLRGGREFAFEAESVERVIGARDMMPSSGPGRICGAVEACGRTVTVLDPGDGAGMTPRGRILLLRGGGNGYGLFADSVAGTETLGWVSREEAMRPDGGRLMIPVIDRLVPKTAERPVRAGLAAGPRVSGGRYVLFSLGERVCGLPAEMILSVLPGSAREGSAADIPYGGGRIPLRDLRVECSSGRRERILVCGTGNAVAGLCVDSVAGVRVLIPGHEDSGDDAASSALPVAASVRFDGVERPVSLLDPARLIPVESPAQK